MLSVPCDIGGTTLSVNGYFQNDSQYIIFERFVLVYASLFPQLFVLHKLLYSGFTNDDFLREMTREMDDEWYKVVVLMGWSYGEVEKVIDDPAGSQPEKIWHVSGCVKNLL